MIVSRRAFLGTLAALPLVAAEEKDATFSTDVRVVSVLATVHDRQGRIVKDLRQEDFALSEDGRAQTIKYFSRETDLPLSIGLLVDTSMSQRNVLAQEKTASFRFLDKVLRADRDKTFVIHFDKETELLQDLTSSRPLLQKALDELELPQMERPSMGGGQGQRGSGGSGGGWGMPGGGIGFPGSGGQRRGRGGYPGQGGSNAPQRGTARGAGTTLYDSILLASDEITRKQKGRKALILLTDGVDMGSKTFLNDAIEAAQRADTLVYSILFADDKGYRGPFGGSGRRGGGPAERPDGRKVLQQISRETGGSFYEVSKKQSIDDIYERLQEELRTQYSVGYSSDAKDAGYRTIRLVARRPDLIVQTREGYYAR